MKQFPLLAALIASLAASASAQTNAARAAGRVSVPSVTVLPFNGAPAAGVLVSPLGTLGLSPSLSAPSLSAAPSPVLAAPAALQPSALAVAVTPAAVKPVVAAKVAAFKAAAPVAVAARAEASALTVLSAASVTPERPADIDAMYDGSTARGEVSAAVPAAKAPLARPSFLKRASLAAGMMIAAPSVALAQATAQVDPGLLTLVTDYAPVATAIAAVIGALIGLLSSREKDGSANAGKVFSATLSYGAIAGAAVFALLDLTKLVFLGAAAASLAPLTAAVTTAALAQNAFAAKFTDPATTPADRVTGAFPVVAAAFGLSIGAIAFLPGTTMLSLGTAAMMLTGAATALYVALFRADKSAADGPAAMGRGLTLQALMTGLALAVPAPYALFFFGLGMWGFAGVIRTSAKEFWAATPESFRNRFKRKS